MAARILDGKETARRVREELVARVARFKEAGTAPKLRVVLVGDDPASRVYVRNKGRSAREIGIDGETVEVPATVSQAELEGILDGLAADAGVHGILLQLPLPAGLDAERCVRRIPRRRTWTACTPRTWETSRAAFRASRRARRPAWWSCWIATTCRSRGSTS